MNIAIIYIADPWQTLVATGLISGIKRAFGDCNISWITSNESLCLLSHNPRLSHVSSNIETLKGPFDFVLNLTINLEIAKYLENIRSGARFGFFYHKESNKLDFCDKNAFDYFDSLYRNQYTNKTFIQLLFRTLGITWKGESYSLCYYPKNKSKKDKTGIAIGDNSLRSYVKNNLKLDLTDLWHIPLRKNILKRIDEINRCNIIVTDDIFTAHAAVAMRKMVYFLDTQELSFGLEFFGRGQHYRINKNDIW